MAKRWTVAEAIVLAHNYRNSDHSEAYEVTDLKWKDACKRSPDVMPMFYELAQYPVAIDLLKRFNESCSVRKLQAAIEAHKDYSTIESGEEDEDEEPTVVARKPKAQKVEKVQKAQKSRLEDLNKNLDVEQLLDLNSLGQV